MGTPAYTRLEADERRRQLLELGADLFARHGYERLSMARIAREAGISKALLFHYFPSKQAYFAATLEQAAAELAETTEPDPDKPPLEQLAQPRRLPALGRAPRGRLREADPQRRRRARGARAGRAGARRDR